MDSRASAGMLAIVIAVLATALFAPQPGGADNPPTGVSRAGPRTAPAPTGSALRPAPEPVRPRAVPSAAGLRAARRYARERQGLVALAVVDSRGRLRGSRMARPFAAASVVKAMVLAAELDRLAAASAPVDAGTDALLSAMIRRSDNASADAIYSRVGDAGLLAVAASAGMRGFTIAGDWGNANITASDMARFFADLDRMLPTEHREYGRSLLGSVVPEQSWGIPVAAGAEWGVRFKGGWLPDRALVHQAGELRERQGPRQVAIAVLTDDQPSHGYGVATIEGVARRLLGTG